MLVFALTASGLAAHARSHHGGKTMFNMQAVAEALMNRQATVSGVAMTMGTLGERQMSEYKVVTEWPGVLAVSIGIAEGADASAPPKYVRFFFAPEHPLPLARVVPGCTAWKKIPNNPKLSPFLYSCRFAGSNDSVEVTFSATLTGDIASASAHVGDLLLQRSVWR